MLKSNTTFAALVMFAASATAADATLETARRCVQVKDSLERLVCFDRAFAGAPAPAVPAAAAPPANAPAVAAAPAVATPAPALGDESIKRNVEKVRQVDASPTSLTAVVTALKETRPRTFRITLDNGNVWQQMDLETLFHVEIGDTVKIEKGRLGGYRMARVTGSGSGWVRVDRLK